MPRTPEERIKRAGQRHKQRDRKRAAKAGGISKAVDTVRTPPSTSSPAEEGVEEVVGALGEEAQPSGETTPSTSEEPRSKHSLDDVIGAIGQLAEAMHNLGANVSMELAKMNDRIVTIEEAQAQGLDTLATQSGLGMLGLTGSVAGEQSQLVQSSSYKAIRETEQQILSEEGYDLMIPNDGHTILVGAVTEEQVRSRREALQRAVNEQHQGGRW